jgi:hydroxylamine reductase
MFCCQCEQTAKGEGCTKIGVCGKKPEVAALQDLLLYTLKGLSQVAVAGWQAGIRDPEVNAFTCEAMFSTLTNVNFDPERFPPLITRCVELREKLKGKVKGAGGASEYPDGPAALVAEGTLDGLIKQGEGVGVHAVTTLNPDIHSL